MNVLTHEPGAVLRSFYSTFSAKWSQAPDFDDEVDIHVTSCHTTPHTVPPLHDTTRHTTPRHATQHNTGHVTPRHATPRHTTPHHATGTGVHIGCAWVCMGVHGCVWLCMSRHVSLRHTTTTGRSSEIQIGPRGLERGHRSLHEPILRRDQWLQRKVKYRSHTQAHAHTHTRTHTHTHTVTYTVTHKVRHTHIHTHTHTHTHTHMHMHIQPK